MIRVSPICFGLLTLSGCQIAPWDYAAQNDEIAACYSSATPDGVTECLAREDTKDPVYPITYKPGNGAFCTPDLDKKACRAVLESANKPSDTAH